MTGCRAEPLSRTHIKEREKEREHSLSQQICSTVYSPSGLDHLCPTFFSIPILCFFLTLSGSPREDCFLTDSSLDFSNKRRLHINGPGPRIISLSLHVIRLCQLLTPPPIPESWSSLASIIFLFLLALSINSLTDISMSCVTFLVRA